MQLRTLKVRCRPKNSVKRAARKNIHRNTEQGFQFPIDLQSEMCPVPRTSNTNGDLVETAEVPSSNPDNTTNTTINDTISDHENANIIEGTVGTKGIRIQILTII